MSASRAKLERIQACITSSAAENWDFSGRLLHLLLPLATSLSKQGRANPHNRRALLDRNFKVAGHAHAQMRQRGADYLFTFHFKRLHLLEHGPHPFWIR